jgi:hypothetical protein
MAKGFVVREPFTRVNPLTGAKTFHAKGETITEAERVADLEASEHEHHVVSVMLPDVPAPAAAPSAPEAEDEQVGEEHG